MSFHYLTRPVLFISLATTLLTLIYVVAHLSPRFQSQTTHNIYSALGVINSDYLIRKVLNTEIDGAFDLGGIQALCRQRNWKKDLIIQCAPPTGGVTNVKNVYMNCVRYAIDIGGGFIIPDAFARGKDIVSFNESNLLPFSHFFDLEYFISSLSIACPQMPIYLSVDDIIPKPDSMKLDTAVIAGGVTGFAIHNPESWSIRFEEWYANSSLKLSTAEYTILEVGTPFLQWSVHVDSPQFHYQFGRLMRSNPEIRRLAAAIIAELNVRYKALPPLYNVGIPAGGFYGAHLRTDADATAAGWDSFDQQTEAYTAEAVARKMSLIYVASGSEADIDTFRKNALKTNQITVLSKLDLLSEADRAELEKLEFDQQGMIDYEVLLRSSYFGGHSVSSFSWAVALRRHVLAEREGDLSEDYLNRGYSLQDVYSTVFGKVGDAAFFAQSLWP